MNTFQLECFLTVAETLNFAKAAQILNITQPAVTKNIKSLEDELNTRLFRRSTRNVELTREGKLLINDAQIIIRTSRRAKKRFSGNDEELTNFTIGVRLLSHIKFLTEPLRELLEKYDKIYPQLHIETTPKLLRALYDEQIDVVFDTENKITSYYNITFTQLFKERILCICTEKFPVYNYESITVDEIRSLVHCPIILLTAPQSFKEITDPEKAFVGNRTQSIVHLCSTAEEACLLTEVGCGIAVIPERIAPNSPNLHKIPVSDCKEISFGVYYKNSGSNEIARKFVENINRHLSKEIHKSSL